MRFFNESLPSHGSGSTPYYAIFLSFNGQRFSKRGIRLSLGGYGWARAWWRPHFSRWSAVATHFGIGPVCLSLVFSTRIPGRLGDWLWDKFEIA